MVRNILHSEWFTSTVSTTLSLKVGRILLLQEGIRPKRGFLRLRSLFLVPTKFGTLTQECNLPDICLKVGLLTSHETVWVETTLGVVPNHCNLPCDILLSRGVYETLCIAHVSGSSSYFLNIPNKPITSLIPNVNVFSINPKMNLPDKVVQMKARFPAVHDASSTTK